MRRVLQQQRSVVWWRGRRQIHGRGGPTIANWGVHLSGTRRQSTTAGGVTVKRTMLPRRGDAICVLGCASQVAEALAKMQQVKEGGTTTTTTGSQQRPSQPPRTLAAVPSSSLVSHRKKETRDDRTSFAMVVASSDAALRSILEARALRTSNVVGCVEPLAFASSATKGGRGLALVVSVECGDGIEAFTFDSRVGALPDLGQPRLTEALAPGMAPHFLLFAGAKPSQDALAETSVGAGDASVLANFRRRIDGLFPGTTCGGVVVRGDDRRPGRLVHARRRGCAPVAPVSRQKRDASERSAADASSPPVPEDAPSSTYASSSGGGGGGSSTTTTTTGPRAGRLKVYRAHGGAVGVALLPRSSEVPAADVGESAARLARLVFGGDVAPTTTVPDKNDATSSQQDSGSLNSSSPVQAPSSSSSSSGRSVPTKNPVFRLWAAGDGTMGAEEHRVHAAVMKFFKAFDDGDATAMENLWLDEREASGKRAILVPSVAHPGAKPQRGFERVMKSWRKLFASTPLIACAGGGFLRIGLPNPLQMGNSADPLDPSHFGIKVEDLSVDLAGGRDLAYATALLNVANNGLIQATHVFVKDHADGRWQLAHYHGSLVFDDESLDDEDGDDDDEEDPESGHNQQPMGIVFGSRFT